MLEFVCRRAGNKLESQCGKFLLSVCPRPRFLGDFEDEDDDENEEEDTFGYFSYRL